ncbi:four helix bundle protein [Danxiaibacter flavus]|uniref:Four helix bundle protein n=1 Tax=Danxiaibacter flavus TaxID=3049108 RepID=A0ABV3Z7W6_9BACT|nr:four helix bundle protein [Chitinophagaceae bacterium DXS]
MRDYAKLEIWKKAHQLTLDIYRISAAFPKSELFGLCSQMRRSSSSVPSNIAEGCGRNTNAQLLNYLQIASGSCSELAYQLLLCKDLGYISVSSFKQLDNQTIELRKMIYSYSRKL